MLWQACVRLLVVSGVCGGHRCHGNLVTVLQFKANPADREAAEAARDRISWKYALGVELDRERLDGSVLSEFRGRLAEPGSGSTCRRC